MKKTLFFVVALGMMSFARADWESDGTYSWEYTLEAGLAFVENVSPQPWGEVWLPTMLGGCRVVEISEDVFAWNTNVTKVHIPQHLLVIDKGTFEGCSNLQELVIPEANMLRFVRPGAFEGCDKLPVVNGFRYSGWDYRILIDIPNPSAVPDWVRLQDGLQIIMEQAFVTAWSTSVWEDDGYAPADFHNGWIDLPDTVRIFDGDADEVSKLKTHVEGGFLFESARKRVLLGVDPNAGSAKPKGKNVKIPDTVRFIKSLSEDDDIESVIFPSELRHIGDEAFQFMASLRRVNLPDSLTDVGEHAFQHCYNLLSVKWSRNESTINPGMFQNCSALREFVWPLAEDYARMWAEFPEIGDYAFKGTGLNKYFYIPEGILQIGNEAFAQCNNLRHVEIPSTCLYLNGDAFNDSKSLRELRFKGNKPLEVEYMDESTYGDSEGFDPMGNLPSGLKIVYPWWSNWKTWDYTWEWSGRQLQREMYQDLATWDVWDVKCAYVDGLVTVVGPSDAFMANATNTTVWMPHAWQAAEAGVEPIRMIMHGAFANCTKMTHVQIPDSVDYIGQQAFYNCINLQQVWLPESDTLGYVDDDAFIGCIRLPEEGGLRYTQSEGKRILTFAPEVLSGEVTISDGTYLIMEDIFDKAQVGITALYLPDSLEILQADAFSHEVRSAIARRHKGFENSVSPKLLISYASTDAFYSRVETFTVPAQIKFIDDGAFSYMTSLKKIFLPDELRGIGERAFAYTALTSLRIPQKVRLIGSSAFAQCTSLKEVQVPPRAFELETDTFYGCSSLEKIVFTGAPLNAEEDTALEGIPSTTYGVYLAAYADAWQAQMTNNVWFGLPMIMGEMLPEELPDGFVVALINGGWYITGYNGAVPAALTIPASYNGQSIAGVTGSAFYNNDTITSVVIENGVAGLGGSAFDGCDNLTSVVLGDSITWVGARAFAACPKLTSCTLGASYVDAFNPQLFEGSHGVSFVVNPNNAAYRVGNSGELIWWATLVWAKKVSGAYTLPSGVTAIGDQAFAQNASLTSIVLPEGVTYIGTSAFDGCTALGELSFFGGPPSVGTSPFANLSAMAYGVYRANYYTAWSNQVTGGYWNGLRMTTTAVPLVASVAQGAGTIAGTGVFEPGATATLSVTPADGNGFLGWIIDGQVQKSPTINVTAYAGMDIKAYFAPAILVTGGTITEAELNQRVQEEVAKQVQAGTLVAKSTLETIALRDPVIEVKDDASNGKTITVAIGLKTSSRMRHLLQLISSRDL